ncbi:myxosortase-dependent phytase-like phosphatase [Archangium lipolyticum]|uniref:myxosortase-dependent phytase-like phosphatase n=1 Tax=Archangium lipolyticum TaxID=2970465 RepID=UPI002DD697EB|nr:myxosortase-dependent phytase-like phosphatase [Archangium lipolyticum]
MRLRTFLSLAVLLTGLPVLAQQAVQVQPSAETVQVLGGGTAVQGATLWVHPTDPASSLLLVADNQAGLLLYQLDGTLRAQLAEGGALGVDVQEGFPVGGIAQPLVMVANQTLQALVGYVVEPSTLQFRRAGLTPITPQGFIPSNVALYASPTTGRFFAFAGGATGVVQQFELTAQTDGGVVSNPVRTLNVGGAVVGLAVDDAQRTLYVVQQGVGIWQYGAEPDTADARTSVDAVTGGGLSQPLGGVALYKASGVRGYLLAASGGDNSVRIYERAPSAHTFRGSVTLAADGGIDAVDRPRFVVASNLALGSRFPLGMVAVHDSANFTGNENFKLVPWPAIANAFTTPLVVDTAPGNGTGTGDGGTPDAGVDGGGGTGGIGPPVGRPGEMPDGVERPEGPSCYCASVSVPGSVLFVLAGVLLLSRRRRGA